MRRYSFQELVDYAFYNRKGKAFIGWSRTEIGMAFCDSLSQSTLFYSVNGGGQINGIVHGVRFDDEKVIFVSNILASSRDVLEEFIRRFRRMFPDYRLEALRHGKRKVYNTPKLVKKITKE